MFRSFTNSKDMLKYLRVSLGTKLGYEDVGILVKDITTKLFQESNMFFSLSPNVAGKDLLSFGNADIFFYNPPSNSLVMKVLEAPDSKPMVFSHIRDNVGFSEGIDNLSPVSFCY